MIRVAILADIHGNMPALEAVLADVDAAGVDEVLVGGDLVGRGPEGSRVIAAIRERGWVTIRGNHEDYLLDFRRGKVPEDWLEADEWSASRWMAAELSAGDVAWMEALPFSAQPAIRSDLLLIHGTPRSHSEGLGPWTREDELDRHLGGIGPETLVCAHTHRPMVRRVAGGLVVNVGSVGLPFNRDRRAQYAVMSFDGRSWKPELRQVEYDLGRTREAYRSTGFLAEGGITARLLLLELEHAAPFLVPFLKWASMRQVEPDAGQLERFLEAYDPEASLRDFFAHLRTLTRA